MSDTVGIVDRRRPLHARWPAALRRIIDDAGHRRRRRRRRRSPCGRPSPRTSAAGSGHACPTAIADALCDGRRQRRRGPRRAAGDHDDGRRRQASASCGPRRPPAAWSRPRRRRCAYGEHVRRLGRRRPGDAPPRGRAPRRRAGAARRRVGEAHRDPHQRHDPARPAATAVGLPAERLRRARRRAARSTTRPTPCCTAPPHLPDPRHAASQRRRTRSWRRSSPPPVAARWHCSPATGRWTPPPRRSGPGSTSPILTQRDLPKPALLEAFSRDEAYLPVRHRGLLAGRRRPRPHAAPRHHRPAPVPAPRRSRCCQARREQLGPAAFRTIDLPRAATLLAQGAGRLIRSQVDRGVVAVLDPPPGHGRLPLGHRARPAADAPHPPPRRGRGLPARCGFPTAAATGLDGAGRRAEARARVPWSR